MSSYVKNPVRSLVAAFLLDINLVRSYILMISRPSLNLGHLGSENRSLGQIMENLVRSDAFLNGS